MANGAFIFRDGEWVPVYERPPLRRPTATHNGGGAGLGAEEKTILLTLLRTAKYDIYPDALIARLEEIWGNGGGDDAPEEPESPDDTAGGDDLSGVAAWYQDSTRDAIE